MKKLLISIILLLGITKSGLFAQDTEKKNELPRVLIIGDSISLAYTPHVKKALEGKAIVTRSKGNSQYTGYGIEHIDKWLGDSKYDVIHFNFGLWDIYGWEHMKVDRSPAKYAERLEKLVVRMKKTKATIIFGTTTPVCPAPEKTMAGRFKTIVKITPEVEKEYQEAALRIMKKHGVKVNDLHAVLAPDLEKYALAKDDVHFNKAGTMLLAKQVSKAITESLNSIE